MQSLLNILKSRYFLIGFGFALLIVLTFFLGAWLEWSIVTSLLITIGLLVVCIGLIVVEFVRASRSAARIEQSIKMQAEQQRMSTRPDKQAEIEELQEQLETAIARLKQSKLGRGRSGRHALHALPWYMFIGPPGAGKTTAIRNSGLNFPVGTDRVRGVGGTRNCDWFFSDQAILLDTAGRYMTEHEDEEEWHAFLDMLKQHRKRRPINGVLVGISIAELLDATPDEIEWHANNIRHRVSELVERLGVRFPVYLVFTKCDLMQGFVNFFGDLSHREREQIWGCTLTEEQREDGDPRTVFEHECDRLYDALVNARTERLRRSMKRKERRQVYVFPLEFASAKDNLALFIDCLFQPNPYQESPEFRGFYFTSGTQEGAPIDRVIQSISEQFDFAPGVDAGTEPEMETKSYFIKDLFTDVVIPDQYMVDQTSSAARRGRFMQFGVGVVAVVLLALFVVGAFNAVRESRADLNRVEEAAQAAAVVQWDDQVGLDLERIDRLREEVVQLQRYEENPPFLQWLYRGDAVGLYQGGAVLEPARDLYYQTMRPLVRIQFQQLQQQLSEAGSESESLGQQERLRLREQLRAYLLLTEEAQRLTDETERTFLRNELTDLITQPSDHMATARLGERSGQVEQQIETFVDGLARQAVKPFESRSTLVERVRRLIYQKPTIENVYAQIKQKGENSLEPVRLSDILRQSGGASLFDTQPEVSGFFTKRGWETYVEERIDQEAQAPGEGDWVLGQGPDELSEDLRDPEKVTEQLREQYFRDYATAWRQFLGNIQYRSFGDLRATARAFNTLGSQFESPLLYILAKVTDETTFRTSALEETAGKLQEEASVHPVNRRMRWLHQLEADKAESGGASPNLTQALEAIREVGNTLDGMIGDRDRIAKFAATVLSENGGELRQQWRAVENALGQFDSRARRELFESPILEGWTAILSAAQQHLDERWRAEVHRPFESNLEGRYPFSFSNQDASLSDVEDFFHPQNGVVTTFYRERLEPFLREDRRRTRTWEGQGLQVSSTTVRMLEKVDQITAGIFSGGELQVTFVLQPEVPDLSEDAPAPSSMIIDVHGIEQEYGMGYQPETTFRWPGERGAALSIRTREGTMDPKEYDGVWAWFRLLDDAADEIQSRSSDSYRVRWEFTQPGRYSIIARYNLYAQNDSELFTNPRSFFRISVPETIN